MGFFDFLASPSQEKPEFVAKGKRPLTPEEAEILKDSPPQGFVPPQEQDQAVAVEQERAQAVQSKGSDTKRQAEKAHLDIQDAYGSAIKALDKAITANTQKEAVKSGEFDLTPNENGPLLESVRDRAGRREHPAKLADDLQELGARTGDKTLIDAAAKLSRAYKAQGELEAMRQPGGPLSVSPEEVAARKVQLESELAKKTEESKLAGEIRSPKLKEEIRALQQEQLRVNQAVPKREPATFAEQNADPALPPTSPKPIESEFNALGVKRKQLVESAIAALEAAGIEEGEWDAQVPTQAGLKRILSVMDREGTLAQQMAADLLAEKQRNQPQKTDEFESEQKSSQQRADQYGQQLQQQRSELKELYKSLNAQPFMQSWLGLTLFVLLGMLAGPTNAAKLLGVGRNRNAILGEIQELKAEMRFNSQEMRREQDYAQRVRLEAIRHKQRESDYKRDKSDSYSKMIVNHLLIMERAKQRAAPEHQEIVKKLNAQLTNTMKMMDEPGEVLRNDWMEEGDPRKRKANAQMKELEEEAWDLHRKLRSLTPKVEAAPPAGAK
jgi:hypothetical protein